MEQWVEHLERLDWAALVLDEDWQLAWISPSLKAFLRAEDHDDLGYGLNLVEAWTSRDLWLRTVTEESQIQMFQEVGPLWIKAMQARGKEPHELVGAPFQDLIGQMEPAEDVPLVWSGKFAYKDPADPELPPYNVNFCVFRLFDDEGQGVGSVMVFFSDMNPNLMSLLVRGDAAMYERMAKLIDPSPQEAVVMFCDLHESGRISRELSSAAYFRLIRRLWTGIDEAIAAETGIIGKHAGDGASAFFLASDLGSSSKAAAASIRTARRIHETSAEVFREAVDSDCLMKIGLHWGSSLYMGQLVPGGRLEVSALGDEVNEAARVESCAEAGKTLGTKQLIERLEPEDAKALGFEVESMRFTPIAELETADKKSVRDAGGIAVITID